MVARSHGLDGRSFALGSLVVVLVLVGAGLVISQATGPQTVGHSMSEVWCDNPLGCIITSWIQNGAVTTVKLADLAVNTVKLADNSVSRQKLQTDSVDSTKIINTSIKAVDVDSSQVQLRVFQDCLLTGGSMESINADGSVNCGSSSTFIVATHPVQQAFNGFVAEVSCPGTHPYMVYCDYEFDKGAVPEITSVKSEIFIVGLFPVCRVTAGTTGVDLGHLVTITAKAVCKS